jgi:hypothetical protein
VSEWELHTGDKQGGPFTEANIVEAIERGLKATVVVRQVGSEEWKSLRTHPPFAMALERVAAGSPPPPPFGLPSRRYSKRSRSRPRMSGPHCGFLVARSLSAMTRARSRSAS